MLGKDFVSEMNDWEALIEKKSEEPFTLVILGEFKRGKSTIINALLGKELAPINVTPETYTINEISFGHTQYVEAILENGMRVPLSLEDITREKLEQRMKLFPAKISYVQIKDNAPILKEIRIVDTPGLSDLESLDKQVMDYIVNADAIMYAASCLLPFSESEQLFLVPLSSGLSLPSFRLSSSAPLMPYTIALGTILSDMFLTRFSILSASF